MSSHRTGLSETLPLRRGLSKRLDGAVEAPGADVMVLAGCAGLITLASLSSPASPLVRWATGAAALSFALLALDQAGRLAPLLRIPAPQAEFDFEPHEAGTGSRRRTLLRFRGAWAPAQTPLVCLGVAAVLTMITMASPGAGTRVGATVIMLLAGLMAALRLTNTLGQVHLLTGEVVAHRRDLSHQALHDPLTGQVSRPLFTYCLGQALLDQQSTAVAVLMGDLNSFKSINDDLGHAAGDSLLAQVAWRLNAHLPHGATLARTGADEFGVILEGLPPATASSAAQNLALELERCLDLPIMVHGREISAAITIGLALAYPDSEALGVDEVLRRADVALQTARRNHSHNPVLYVEGLSLPEAQDWQLRPAVAQALREGEIIPYYQLVVELDSGRVRAFEALARWDHAEAATVGPHTPDVFLPVITRAGLLPQLTDRMLIAAADQLSLWHQDVRDCQDLQITVNVSPVSIVDPRFPDRVAELLAEHGRSPQGLILEITEEKLLDDLDTAEIVLRQLRDLGVQIWLDDFGAGYSSLAMLHRLPLDAVKLDKDLIRTVDTDASLRRMVGGLLALSADLDITVVAEGIQRVDQVMVLRDLGCPLGQGYLFSPPVPPSQCAALLRHRGIALSAPAQGGRGWSDAAPGTISVVGALTGANPGRTA